MKYHIVIVILSFILFVFRFIIPVEVIFLISGIYYIHILFIIKYFKSNKWLVPPQLFTFMMFISIFMPSILIYYGEMIYERFNSTLFNELNIISANVITLFATSTMWLSFTLASRRNIFEIATSTSNIIKPSVRTNKKIFILFLILVAVQFYGLKTGISGYLVESSSTGQLISLAGSLSNLILVYYFFNNYETILKKYDIKFLIMIFSLVILGFAFAQKYKVISPFLYLLLIDYFKRKKFNQKIISIGFLVFILSFIIVPIIRDQIRNEDEIQVNITSINKNNVNDAFMSFLYRTSYVPQLVLAIDYTGKLPPSVENLWEYQLLSPVYSVTPRTIYKNKPEITFGRWFSFNIYGSTRENNIGATYQGILYLNGGLVSVFFGFFLLGLFQALCVNLFFNSRYIPIYLSLLIMLFMLPQEPWLFYVRLIQSTITFVLFYKLFMR